MLGASVAGYQALSIIDALAEVCLFKEGFYAG
jgi:hypothetical protein